MDLAMLAPEIAKAIGVSPTTFLLFLFVANVACRAISRAIPDDATGLAAFVRRLTAIIGVEVSSKLTSTVSLKDVGKAALETPGILKQVGQNNEDR